MVIHLCPGHGSWDHGHRLVAIGSELVGSLRGRRLCGVKSGGDRGSREGERKGWERRVIRRRGSRMRRESEKRRVWGVEDKESEE